MKTWIKDRLDTISAQASRRPWLAAAKRLVLSSALPAWRCLTTLGRAPKPAALRRPPIPYWIEPCLAGKASPGAVQPAQEPTPSAAASFVVVMSIHNGLSAARTGLEYLFADKTGPRLVLVDDASDGHTAAWLRTFADSHAFVSLLRNDHTLGPVASVNRGLEQLDGQHAVILDSHVLLHPLALEALMNCAQAHPEAALISPLSNVADELWFRPRPGDSCMQTAARLATEPAFPATPVDRACEACAVVSPGAIKALGKLDEACASLHYALLDYALRAGKAGFETLCCLNAYIHDADLPPGPDPVQSEMLGERWPRGVPPVAENRLDILRAKLDRDRPPPFLYADEADRHYHESFTALIWERGFDRQIEDYRQRLGHWLASPRRLSKPPRITFLINRLQRSGGVIAVAQLINDLILLGADVKVVVQSPRGLDRAIPLLTEPIFFRDTAALLRHFPESDIVVGTFWNTMFAVARLFMERGNFVPAYFVQDYEPDFLPESDLELRRWCAITYRLTPYCFASSPWLCGRVREAGGQAYEILHPLDLDLFYPRGRCSDSTVKTILTMLRPSTPRRGFDTAVQVFSKLAALRSDFEVHAFGAAKHELASCEGRFPLVNRGRVPNHRMPELYTQAWCFAEFSAFHGFGRTIAESFACGTPAVVTRSGGADFFCEEGVNCLVAPPGDVDGLVGAVNRLLDDSGLRARLAGQCRASAGRFDRRRSARATLDFFHSLAGYAPE